MRMIKQKRWYKSLVYMSKFSAAVVVILAIGFAFISFDNPTGEVSSAEADVWSVFTRESSKHEEFMKVLEQEGMAPPRQYDYNGNQVFFSYATTPESPREVMLRFQESFQREGVNSHFHPGVREPNNVLELDESSPEGMAMMAQGLVGADDFFTGGMVPVVDTRNQMAMVGVTTKRGANSLTEVITEHRGGETSMEDMISSMRYLDANREEGGTETTITAVWSDEYLDLSKFQPDTRSPDTLHDFEFEVPTCRGCTRVARLSGMDGEEGRHNLLFRSPSGIQETVAFYDRNMGDGGWELEPAIRGLNELQELGYGSMGEAQIRAYIKGGMNLTLLVYRDQVNGQTYVKMVSDR